VLQETGMHGGLLVLHYHHVTCRLSEVGDMGVLWLLDLLKMTLPH
jgi:hypothetical protein